MIIFFQEPSETATSVVIQNDMTCTAHMKGVVGLNYDQIVQCCYPRGSSAIQRQVVITGSLQSQWSPCIIIYSTGKAIVQIF